MSWERIVSCANEGRISAGARVIHIHSLIFLGEVCFLLMTVRIPGFSQIMCTVGWISFLMIWSSCTFLKKDSYFLKIAMAIENEVISRKKYYYCVVFNKSCYIQELTLISRKELHILRVKYCYFQELTQFSRDNIIFKNNGWKLNYFWNQHCLLKFLLVFWNYSTNVALSKPILLTSLLRSCTYLLDRGAQTRTYSFIFNGPSHV